MDNEFLDRSQLEDQYAAEEKTKKKKSAKKAKKVAEKKAATPTKPNALVQILNGDFLTREFIVNNLNFIFFIILLLLLIVGKGYYGKQLSADVVNTQQELDVLTSDYFEAKAQLEEVTQRSVLLEKLESSGLKETVNPTKVIRIQKDDE